METTTMRTWAEIKLDHLAQNYNILRDMIPEGCKLLGLCKANAYGHGATKIAQRLERLGVDMLAVASLEEGIELRNSGVQTPIICLGYTDPSYCEDIVAHHITVTVSDSQTARGLSEAAGRLGASVTVHIKLDTGMTRFGFYCEDGNEGAVADELAALWALPNLHIEGLFTHFADSEGNEDYTMAQFTRYLAVRDRLLALGHQIPICHTANSGATLNFPATHLDMVRPGLLLYGYYPDDEAAEMDGNRLQPVMVMQTRIWAVRDVPAGRAVSYGCTQTLERDSKLAVLPIGYGDGYPRRLSGEGKVEISGVLCPIVGRVCMDLSMVDVTDLPDVKVGDVAIVYGEAGLLPQDATIVGSIVYELLCDVSPRVQRIYTEGNTLA